MAQAAIRMMKTAGALMRRVSPRRRVIVLPPTSEGSMGDQAMLDVACRTLTAEYGCAVSVFDPYGGDHPPIPVRTTVDRLKPSAALASRVGARMRTAAADTLAMIGADSLDGVYGPRRGLMRLRLISGATDAGVNGLVFGCSFSATPAPEVVAQLRRMPSLTILARDPVSRARMETALERPIELVADLAFLLEPEARAEGVRVALAWIAQQRAAERRVVAVNISGHTLNPLENGEAHLAGLLDAWMTAHPDIAVLLTPHDTRPAPVGDVAPLEAVYAALSPRHGDRLSMVTPPFDAWDAKAIGGAVDWVLTGRMHFAIAAMGMGTPALCIVYQGKFEGLMRHFELDGLTLAPTALATRQAIEAMDATLARVDPLRDQIKARLPAIKTLATKNFASFNRMPSASRAPIADVAAL